MRNVSLDVFAIMLLNHDWTYQRSDCTRAYRAGREDRLVLNTLRQQSDDHRALFEKAERKFG